MELTKKSCVPCQGGVPALKGEAIQRLLAQLEGWEVVAEHHLSKTYSFPDYATALGFVNRVSVVAENEGHHPDIYLSWGKVRLEVWTHKIDGLTESDFIFAAKADEVL